MTKPFPSLIAFVLLFMAAGCSPKKKPPAIPPAPVEVTRVTKQTVPLDLPAIGSAQALATVQLKARVMGQIDRVHFTEGAVVQPGDVLFSIDARPFDVAISRAQAHLASAQVNASNAESQLQRYSALTGQGAASKEQLAQYQTSANSLKADLQARQADLDEAKLSREWTEIKSPIAGRIGAALFKEGNIIQANADTLAVINQIQPIHIAFSLPEKELPAVREAAEKSSLAVIVQNAETHQELGRGSLDFIDNMVDRDTGTISLKARLANEKEQIWPGQFVDLVLRLAEEKDCLIIPTTAVMDAQNGSQVLVVQDKKATLRKIEISRTYGDLTIVRSGLQVGDSVISSGQLRVSPGATVVPREVPLPGQVPVQAPNPPTAG
ncbi:MAG TPA: efflux RND transporter periplasmic adaptor subunit [Chthoniobacterales bacterium]|jgi:multidrug efflux system membrane fusion protein